MAPNGSTKKRVHEKAQPTTPKRDKEKAKEKDILVAKPAEKNMPAWLQFDLSLPACSRVLAALHADAAAAWAAAGGGGKSTLASQSKKEGQGTSRRFARHTKDVVRPPVPGCAKQHGVETRLHEIL